MTGALTAMLATCGSVKSLPDAAGLGGSANFTAPDETGPDGCGADCVAFPEGTVVTLTATAATGSTFAGWSGDCAGRTTCTVTMDRARSVVATFSSGDRAVDDAATTVSPRSVAAGREALTVTPRGDGHGRVTSVVVTAPQR